MIKRLHKLCYIFLIFLIVGCNNSVSKGSIDDNKSALYTVDIIRYGDLLPAQQFCWIYNVNNGYHAINNSGYLVRTIFAKSASGDCDAIASVNHNNRDTLLDFTNIDSEFNNISDVNNTISGAVGKNNVGYFNLNSGKLVTIDGLQLENGSSAMISSNSQYLFPQSFVTNAQRKMVAINKSGYSFIDLIDEQTKSPITEGDIRIGSNNGTVIVNKKDGDLNQYICPGNGKCKLLNTNGMTIIKFPLLSDDGKLAIANFIEEKYVYEIDPITATIKKTVEDSENYDIDLLIKVFNNGVFMFLDGQIGIDFLLPKSATQPTKVVYGADLINKLHIAGVDGKDFIIEQISNDGKSFVLENVTAVSQAEEIHPTNDTVLNVVVRNNPLPIWEM